MFTRRTFLKSAVLVPTAVAPLFHAQASAETASEKLVFAAARTPRCFTRADIPTRLARQYDDIVRRIHLEVWTEDNAFQAGDTVTSIAARISRIADTAVRFSRAGDDPASLALLRAETLVAWMRTNVDYWSELNAFPGKERVAWNAPKKVLSHSPRPKCNCDGFGRLTTALAAVVGVTALGVGGSKRQLDGTIDAAPDTVRLRGIPWNHGWNLFEIGGKYLPADVSGSWKFRD